MSLYNQAPWASFPLVSELVASLSRAAGDLAWTAPRMAALEREAARLPTERLFETMRGLLRLGAALEDTGERHAAQQLAPVIDRLALLLERGAGRKPRRLEDEVTLPSGALTPPDPAPALSTQARPPGRSTR